MYERWIQTLDPDRFALDKVQYVVNTLKESGRDFIVMVDPAVFSGTPNSSVESYETYQNGVEKDIFMKLDSGDIYQGVVWPGPTAFPDWTHPNAQQWWTQEFGRFFNNETGFDVSGIWLDMNEPANFLPYVSLVAFSVTDVQARGQHLPSVPRTTCPSSSRTTSNCPEGVERLPRFPIWTQHLGCLEWDRCRDQRYLDPEIHLARHVEEAGIQRDHRRLRLLRWCNTCRLH